MEWTSYRIEPGRTGFDVKYTEPDGVLRTMYCFGEETAADACISEQKRLKEIKERSDKLDGKL